MNTCDHCGKTDESVSYVADPYLLDIDGEVEESWWCDTCYGNRADDI